MLKVRDKYPVRFDARRLIDDLGGPTKVHQMFDIMGAELSLRTIEQWRHRDDMPAEAVATIMLWSMRGGSVYPIHDYLLERDGDA
jgi:hypothetical protein